MERSGSEPWKQDDAPRVSLAGLVELIVAISDETDDQWEIDERVGSVMRGGVARAFD